tara:strand:- start:1821 stop:2141 length:321 start_codon:yes stop_codon:yes gene_type:complete
MRKQRNTMVKLNLAQKSLNHLGETKDPIRSLWRNVLIVALEDAVGRHWRNKTYGSPHGHFAISAKEYFTHPNGDFKMVCTLAGFDHEYIRKKAQTFFERQSNEKNM